MILEEEIWRLQEENEKKEVTIIELRMGEERRKGLERELNIREEEVTQLKQDRVLLEQKVQQLSGIKQSVEIPPSQQHRHDVHMKFSFDQRPRRITCLLLVF